MLSHLLKTITVLISIDKFESIEIGIERQVDPETN